MLKTPASSRKLSVCLLANHPLVLAEFERLVSHMPIRIQPRKTQPLAPDAAIPRAGVYVIDFDGNLVVTESTVARITASSPDARLLLVGREFNDEVAFPLLRLGVKGLLEHSQLEDQLERAMQAIAGGGYWVPPALLREVPCLQPPAEVQGGSEGRSHCARLPGVLDRRTFLHGRHPGGGPRRMQ